MPFVIDRLCFAYNGAQSNILNNLTLTVNDGQCVIVRGENGCGKSTLIKIITGIIPDFTAGKLDYKANNGSHIMCVLQNVDKQLLTSTVQDEVDFFHKYSHSTADKNAALKELEPILDKKLSRLSSGQKQKTVIACASITDNNKLVLLDEPSACLDEKSCAYLSGKVEEFKKQGLPVLIVTHDETRLKHLADKIYLLKDGALGPVTTLPNTDYSAITPKTFGQGIKLEINNLNYEVNGQKIFQNFNCTINGGRVTGLCGSNASGKTTLARLIAGHTEPSGGEMLLNNAAQNKKSLRANVKLITHNPYNQLIFKSVCETVARANEAAKAPQLKEKLYGVLKIDKLINRDIDELSWGQAHRVLLYKNMLLNPDMLILDEVFTSIDRYGLNYFLEALNLFVERGKIVLLVSHNREHIDNLCSEQLHL